jgi:hypothetical protein
MVEKVITFPCDIVDFARRQVDRSAADKAVVISTRACRHCGAMLLDGEREDECSSAFNVEAAGPHRGHRKLYAD